MEWDEMVESVGRFGLTERESVLYLALLRRGRATARELAREAQIDRVVGYRMLDSMRARGMVEMTAERPRRYAPTPPTDLFERNLRERRRLLDEDERKAKALGEQLSTLAGPAIAGAARYQILTGTARIYDYLREMVRRSRREIAVMLTFRSMRESMSLGIQDRIAEYVRGGGRFRLIVESDPRLRPTLTRIQASLRRYPGAEFRQMSPQSTRLTIIDGSEALLFLVPEARDRQTDQIAVWTEQPEFVAGQTRYFQAMWESAGSASLRATGSARLPGWKGPKPDRVR